MRAPVVPLVVIVGALAGPLAPAVAETADRPRIAQELVRAIPPDPDWPNVTASCRGTVGRGRCWVTFESVAQPGVGSAIYALPARYTRLQVPATRCKTSVTRELVGRLRVGKRCYRIRRD